MISKKKQIIIFAVIFLLFMVLGITYYSKKLTYIEQYALNTSSDTYVDIYDPYSEIVQEFTPSCDLINRLEFRIGTYDRVNNSQWQVSIVNSENSKVVLDKTINASTINDNSYYAILFDNKNLKLSKDIKYEIHIKSVNATELTGLAFYTSNGDVIDGEFLVNGKKQVGDLCIKLYGGNIDFWWIGEFVFFMLYILLIALLYFKFGANGIQTFKKKKILQALIIALVVFACYFTFSDQSHFIDENDNVMGGMIIAKGGVLYKDYVTQHTPVTYYLCALFALLGASSVAQMRILYYILISIIWGALFYRHSEYFGKGKMILLPTFEVIFTTSLFSAGYMILSDGVQGVCMVALVLEFIRYIDDKQLGLTRSIIASICIWGSFGAAFVSAYALIFIGILLLIEEIKYLRGVKITPNKVARRYINLFTSVVVPPLIAIIYFKLNHALRLAFNLTFKFNTEVYPLYIGGFGTKKIQPIINGFQSFWGIVANTITNIATSTTTNIELMELLVVMIAIGIIIKLFFERKYVLSLLLFFLMCGNSTRGYNFHGLAAWYIVVLVVALYWQTLAVNWPKIGTPLFTCTLVLLVSIYVENVGNNILAEQDAVSDIETAVIEQTEPGNKILLDAYTCDSVYLLYKDRYPVNVCTFFLPWYMSWYEHQTIETLKNEKPKVIVYDQDVVVFKKQHFTNAFLTEAKKNYVQYSEDPDSGWEYNMWVRKY